MNPFKALYKFFFDPPFTGLIKDPRSYEEKLKDYQQSEIVSAAPVIWIEKTSYKSYTLRDQDGSSSCVGQGSAKAIETLLGAIESAHPIYRPRKNFPGEGMWLQDGGDIAKNRGTTTETLDPSQNISEVEMNRDVTVETPVKILNYVFVDQFDIDAIAATIDTFKHCVLTFKSTYQEWVDIPVASPYSLSFWGHCVCAVDYTLYKGQKALIIEDSWGHATSIGNGGQRIITEAYLKARATGAMHFIQPIPTQSIKPKYTFTVPLVYGMMGNGDVKALQDILRYEGLFNFPNSTGNFLSVTAQALQKYQIKNGILDYQGVQDVTKIRCGYKTIALLNANYS